jgi:nitrogen fixation/metabolism regulation signal transduction histidine kinase
MPLLNRENPQGFIRVILHSPEVRKIYGSTQERFMVLYGVVLSLVLTTIVIMTQQLRKPIDWLAESLSLIAEGNFKSLRPYRRNDEFTPLFESLERVSRVMQSVQESWHAGESRVLDSDDVLEEGVVVLDPQMRLRFANPTAVALLGSSVDSLLVQDWDRVLANNGALREPIAEVVQKGMLVRERDVELNIQERWVELRLNGIPLPRMLGVSLRLSCSCATRCGLGCSNAIWCTLRVSKPLPTCMWGLPTISRCRCMR